MSPGHLDLILIFHISSHRRRGSSINLHIIRRVSHQRSTPILPPGRRLSGLSQPLGPRLSSLPSPSGELPSQTSLSSWNQRHQSSKLINLLSTTHGGSTANTHLQPTMVITPRSGSYHKYPLLLTPALAQKYPTLCFGNLICSH